MEYEKNNSSFTQEKSSQGQVKSGSFSEILQSVKEQVEYECLVDRIKYRAEEVCLIIAEVMKLPPDAEIQIGKIKLAAEMVQEIYKRLSCEHIELVIQNFDKAGYEIIHKKTYLRTALYNVVFEFDSYWQNQINKDFPGGWQKK